MRMLSAAAGLLAWLIFPQTCCHCREDLPRVISGGIAPPGGPGDASGPGRLEVPEALCAECARKLAPAKPPWCARCGDRVSSSRIHCRPCSRRLFSTQIIRPAVYYGGPAASVVHALKYRNRRDAARLAGRLMAETLDRLPELKDADALVPVPLHPSRLKERGFNQALLLANEVGARTGKPVAELLTRRVATKPQWRLRRQERARNLDDAFAVDQEAWARFDGGRNAPGQAGGHEKNGSEEEERPTRMTRADIRVILVDDVCTTSSTLEGCGRALRQSGAAKVSALVFARQSRAPRPRVLVSDRSKMGAAGGGG